MGLQNPDSPVQIWVAPPEESEFGSIVIQTRFLVLQFPLSHMKRPAGSVDSGGPLSLQPAIAGIFPLQADAVIGGFLGNMNIVRMAFLQPSAGDSDKLAVLLQVGNRGQPQYPMPERRPPIS